MADTIVVGRMSSGLTALRGVLLLILGLVALFAPAAMLIWLVWLGGAMFLVDGLLGLWSLTFGKAKTGNFWFDVARNILAVIVGVLLLVSWMAGLTFVTFMIYVAAIQAIIVGVMELVFVFRARQVFGEVWPVALAGLIYLLFGIMLVFWPIESAVTLVMIGGAFAVIFAIGLFGLAWRLHKAGM
jgi:uncharacterized membrane protein HdeD (DUF308 family)